MHLFCLKIYCLPRLKLAVSTKQRLKCLAQGHNTVPLVSLLPVTLRSQDDNLAIMLLEAVSHRFDIKWD